MRLQREVGIIRAPASSRRRAPSWLESRRQPPPWLESRRSRRLSLQRWLATLDDCPRLALRLIPFSETCSSVFGIIRQREGSSLVLLDECCGEEAMSSGGSVTHWINMLKVGDAAGVQKLWEGYFSRLVGLARKKLREAPRRAADEEDVALSAFDSFCDGVARKRFTHLADRDDLWRILVTITAHKALQLVRHGPPPK